MKESVYAAVSYISLGLEFFGIVFIAAAALYATVTSLLFLLRGVDRKWVYVKYRRRMGRGILIGLEFLVAADIINTVVIEPTLLRVGGLAVIVLIRTFLSFTLEVEMTGRWPWQGGSEGAEFEDGPSGSGSGRSVGTARRRESDGG